jgi:peptidoglycan/xylan/chitin deacetylase (PgdA/CDA1 family)
MLKHKFIPLVFIAIALAIWFIPDSRTGRFYFVYGFLGLVYLLFTIYGSYFIQANYFIDLLHHGNRQQKKIALTFDDGPQPGFTAQVLDILKEKQVPALFFLIGQNVKGNEGDLQRMDAEGHIVGNHSYSHNYWFSLKQTNNMLADIKLCDEEVMRVMRKQPKLFRPPYGVTNPMVANAIRQGNYTGMGWSLRSYDTSAKDPDRLLNKILAKLKNGDVILLHEWGKYTIAILPDLIDKSRKLGFEFVRADELLGVEAYY